MNHRGCSVAVVLAVTLAPAASEISRLDVEALCSDPCLTDNKAQCRLPEDQARYRSRRQKECVGEEQAAYDYVKGRWDGVPPKVRKTCLRGGQLRMRPCETMRYCVSELMREVDRNRDLDRRDGRFHY